MANSTAHVVLLALLAGVAYCQYYGRLLPCPRSYLDPDADCLAGIAGKDYPLHSTAPTTSFQCNNHPIVTIGYFADVETECQVFHVCLKDGRRDTFICPNGTLFNQQFLVCDWWFNVKCENAVRFYHINNYLETPVVSRPLPPLSPNVRPLSAGFQQEARPPNTDSQSAAAMDQMSTDTKQSNIMMTSGYNFRPITARPTAAATLSGNKDNTNYPFYSIFQAARKPAEVPARVSLPIPTTVYGSRPVNQQPNRLRYNEQMDYSQYVMPRNRDAELSSAASSSSTDSMWSTTTSEPEIGTRSSYVYAQNVDFAPWIPGANSTTLLGLPRGF